MFKAVTSLHVEGFRSLKNVTLEPGRVTVLIGANGAGKSNLLSALRLVPLMRTHSLRRVVGEAGGASALLHYGPQTTREIRIRIEFEQDRGRNAYDVRLGLAAGDSLIFLDEQVEYQGSTAAEFRSQPLGTGHVEAKVEDEARNPANKTAQSVRWLLARTNFYHFHDTSATSSLRQFSRQEEVRFLRSDGSNLAAYLHALATGESEAYRAAWTRINSLVRSVAPYVARLEPTLVSPDMTTRSAIRLDWIDARGYYFGAHQLSDGTLRAIALITALAQPFENLPAFIAIDEPELGLHPAAIALLAGLVKSVSPRCQVLLATQSPALLDHFAIEDVVVSESRDGETVLRRLDAERLAIWLEDYSLSDLWNKNVLGGRP